MPAVLPLHEITADLAALEAALHDNGGEIDDATEDRYADLLQMHADKVAGYVAVIRRISTTADAFKAEADRLAAHARAAQRSADALKERLLHAMLDRGETSHATPLGKVAVRYASTRPLVVDVDVRALPLAFLKRPEPDRQALADALKAGDRTAALCAHFGEPTPYLSIR